MPDTPIKGRALEALRAAAMHPLGLRLSAHPKAMQALVVLGYVEVRPAQYAGRKRDDEAWFLTDAGHALLRAVGTGLRLIGLGRLGVLAAL